MSEHNKIDSVEYIQDHISSAEGKTIKDTIQKIPLLSYITCTKYNDNDDDDDNNTQNYGGFLVDIHKTYFKLIQDINNMDSVIKIKYSKINKIYYVTNVRTYHRSYQNANKDKKKESDRKYYLKKKKLKEQELLNCIVGENV